MTGCLESGSLLTSFSHQPVDSCSAVNIANNLKLLVNESATLESEIYFDAMNPRKINEKLHIQKNSNLKQLTNSIRIKQLKNKTNKLILKIMGHPLLNTSHMHVAQYNFACRSSYSQGIIEAEDRRKRSVLHLYNMVLCATGCNPLLYKGYGCYCGFLGSGYAVDGIDSCCKMHDKCYNTAKCPTFLEYFIPYKWKCYFHQPLCGFSYDTLKRTDYCSQRLCECDRQLALCLRRYPCPRNKALCTSSPWRLFQNVLTN